MTAYTAVMECFFRLHRLFGFMLVAVVTWFDRGISRLDFMMAGYTFCNFKLGVPFVRESNNTDLGIKLNNFFLFRYGELTTRYNIHSW